MGFAFVAKYLARLHVTHFLPYGFSRLVYNLDSLGLLFNK